ncbi:MAG: bacteriohemerythrin, partial [Gallionellaceae bacterium]|nr:bacteriohemerythrin [Gallionellaceae bacterium]
MPLNSIDIFPWDDNFNTGLPKVDEQHKKLVQMLNTLASNIAYGANTGLLSRIFDEMAEYAVYHFDTEEAIWREYLADDPAEANHHATHQSFVQEVVRLKASLDSHSLPEVAEETLGFLAHWLTSHILESDRYLAYIVLALKEELSLEAAKLRAKEQMGGATRALINITLSIYSTLSTNTLRLMRELAAHRQSKEELIRTRHELQERDRYQRALLDNFPFLVWLKDTDSRFLAVNRPFVEACKRGSTEEMAGLTDLDVWPQDLAEAYRADDREVLTSNHPKQVEEPIETPDGRRWFETYKSPVELDGKTIGTVGFARDITDRYTMERQLKDSEERFRRLFESSPDPVWIIDDHHFVECNQAAMEMLGYRDKESLKNTHPSALSPEYQPDGESSYSKAERMMSLAREKGLHRFEWVHTRKDGSNFFAEVTLSAITLQERPVIHCLWRDITERKAAEEALLQSEEKLRAILDGVDACIYLKDTAGRYLFANAAVRELWQTDMAGIVGFGDEKFFDAKTVANIRRNDRRVLVNGEILRTEDTNTVITGRSATYLTVKLPLRREDGSIYALCGISTDITQRIKSEEALKHSHASLEQQFAFTQSVLNNAPMGIHMYRLEQDGRLIFTGANQAAERILGVNNSQFVGKNIEDAFPSLAQTEAPERYRQIAREGGKWSTGQIVYEDGVIKGAFEIKAFQTTPGQMAVFFEDATRAKQQEQALRASEERFDLAMRASNDGLWDWDMQTQAIYFSPRWKSMLGYRDEELENAFAVWEQLVDDEGR